MTLKYFNVKNGLVTGNITLDATSSNVTANTFIGNISVTSSANLGPASNINIAGGTSGQVLATDGTGNLYWTTTAGTYSNSSVASYLANYGSNVIVTTGNVTAGNISGGNVVSANFFTGNGHYLTDILGTQVSGEVAYANVANSVSAANVSGLGNLSLINKDGNSSNVLYGNGVFASASLSSYGNSNVATYLPTYTGNLSPNNLTVTTSANLGSINNVTITGGTTGQYLKTDGAGNLSWSSVSGGGATTYVAAIVDEFVGDGANVDFTLSAAPDDISLTVVNYNGALQLKSSYSVTGNVITFSEAPANGAIIEVTSTSGVTEIAGSFVVRHYTGDGSDTTFSVSGSADDTNILVTLNGVLQSPTLDYTVSSGVITFLSAPGLNEKIQIRELKTAVSSASVSAAGSNSQIQFNTNDSFGASANLTFNSSTKTLSVDNASIGNVHINTITSNLIPNANVTYDLGNTTNRFKDLYLSGNTIYIGGATIKTDETSGAIALVPQPTVAVPNPTGFVISASGTITTVATTSGIISNSALANAIANTPSYASTTYVDSAVANLVNAAPSTLDTLNELAAALGNDASFSTTITNTLANKLNSNAFTYANISGAPTLGNIVTINKDGNASNILYGNGVFASAPVTYANANVAAYLPTYTGNLSPGNLTVGLGNLKISGGSANYVIKTDGAGNLSWAAQSGGSSTMSFVKEYVWRGGLTENTGTLRHYIHTASTLTGIYAYLVSAGLTQSTVVVKKNGTSINTITIPANSSNVSQSGLSISLAAGDYLTVDITQSSSASDLYINFVYQG